MNEFNLYLKLGLEHVLDVSALDHVLFLAALVIPYLFKDFKKILLLVSLFTLGHTLALFLSVFKIVQVNASFVEFLIPLTIAITALYYVFNSNGSKGKNSISFVAGVTLFFGLIHGLGFSNYFKMMVTDNSFDVIIPLISFALGIEAAQLIVVFIVLCVSYIAQHFLRFSKKEWTLILAAFILGMVTPMFLESEIWK